MNQGFRCSWSHIKASLTTGEELYEYVNCFCERHKVRGPVLAVKIVWPIAYEVVDTR